MNAWRTCLRSALEELEQLLKRTRAVEASLAAGPLPRCCSGPRAGQDFTHWAPQLQAAAHCAPAAQPAKPCPAAQAPAMPAHPDDGHRVQHGATVHVRYDYCDEQHIAAGRHSPAVPNPGATRRRPRMSMGLGGTPRPAPTAKPITRRRCGVPRSPLEAALWQMADAKEAWAAERAAARREADELRKRNARLERELRQLQACWTRMLHMRW